ncbi:uncharacterized protein [Dysidea avara]|uniref:uncharacterized protein isoform X1 n=1 Tax=Dysidea avara TaxID=196820 RepID=UPI00331F2960
MNFSACWIVSSDIETDVFGVATDVPGQFACVFNLRLTSVPAYSFTGLSIECHDFSYQLSLYTSDVNLQVSLLRCIRHSVDGIEQVSSVDCSGIKGVNFQCLLDCVIRYRNKCFWCCDRCSRSQYRHADIQEIITIVGTIFSQVLM